MGAAYEKGKVLFAQRRWREAAERFRAALAADPTSAPAATSLALSLLNAGDVGAAQAMAGEAIRTAPAHAHAHYAMARVLLRRNARARWLVLIGRGAVRRALAEAQAAMERAIELNPRQAAYWGLLRAIEADGGKWAASLASADRGLALDPIHVACARQRVVAMWNLGRPAHARAECERLLAAAPENAVAHRDRGWLWLAAGGHAQAAEHFREALRLDPMDRAARAGLREARSGWNPVNRTVTRIVIWTWAGANRVFVMVYAVAVGVMTAVNWRVLRYEFGTAGVLATGEAVALTLALVGARAAYRRTIGRGVVEPRGER